MAQLCIIGKIRTCGKMSNAHYVILIGNLDSFMGKRLAWNSLFDKLFNSSLTSSSCVPKWLNKIQIILMGIPSSPALWLFSQYDYGGVASIENVYVKLIKELI